METLRVSPDRLMALVEELLDVLQEKDKLDGRLDDVISALNDSWEGDEALSLLDKVNCLRAAEQEERVILKQLISSMVNTVELYQQAENELISSIKDLKIDEVV